MSEEWRMDIAHLFSIENLAALLTLTALEIVLGIDNIVVLAVITGKLNPDVQSRARRIGLALAMLMRIALLLSLSLIMRAQQPLFSVVGHDVSGRDLVLLGGGLFLLWKSVREMHHHVEGGGETEEAGTTSAKSFSAAIAQIVMLDIVFSLDSVITAVGMANNISIMVAAIIIAVLIMMIFADAVSSFVNRHPTIRMLALAFLLLIGVMLLTEGFGKHFNRGYIYFAMAFSLGVEMLNLRARSHLEKRKNG
jgi:predicted tellurium resistance membrane protein TerC